MLDLRQYASLGAALRDALERWPGETCLIEADRDREKVRLTYSDFKETARPLCRALEDADFKAGDLTFAASHFKIETHFCICAHFYLRTPDPLKQIASA